MLQCDWALHLSELGLRWTQGGIAVAPEVYDALAWSEVLNIEQEQKR